MENFDRALALETIALESTGSAMDKFNIYQESGAAASERLTNEFQKLFLQLDSGVVIGLINATTALLKFTSDAGGLKTILILLTGIMVTLKIETIKLIIQKILLSKTLLTLQFAFSKSTLNAVGFSGALKLLAGSVSTATLVLGGLTLGITALFAGMSIYNAKTAEAKQKNIELVKSFLDLNNSLQKSKDSIQDEKTSREDIIKILESINKEYAEEKRHIKDLSELRKEAIDLIDSEAKSRAKTFIASSGSDYGTAKKFMEEGKYSNIAKGITLDYGGDPKKELLKLEEQILELQSKEKLGRFTGQVRLKQLTYEYNIVKDLIDTYGELYETGKLAFDVKENGLNTVVNKTVELDTETQSLLDATNTYVSSLQNLGSQVIELAKEFELLDKTIEKVSSGQEMSANEIFNLLEKYPMLHSAIIQTADGYKIELSALQNLRKEKLTAQKESIENSIKEANMVLQSKGVMVKSYETEIDAINGAIDARINYLKVLAYEQTMAMDSGIGRALSQKTLGDIKSLEDAKGVASAFSDQLKAAQKMLTMLGSGHALYTTGTSGADAKKAAEERKKLMEQLLATEIKIRRMQLEAERKAVEDSYNQQIDLLKKVNDERQTELDLINAKERLLNAQAQKVKKVYYEGQGWVWETDKKAIADARADLEKLNQEAKIRALEQKKETELAKVDAKTEGYEKTLLARMKSTTDAGTRAVFGSALGLTEFKGSWYDDKGTKVFKEGGVNDSTGYAWLDGKPNEPEIVLNNKQSAGLFNWIKNLASPKSTPAFAGATGSRAYNFYGGINLPNVSDSNGFIRELELLSKIK